MPGKSHRYGIKIFKLCDEKGYTLNLSIYSGRGDGQGTKVVSNLADTHLGVGQIM